MTDFGRVVEVHKEYLPMKAKRWNYPQFLWISPPYQVNFQNNQAREILAKSLDLVSKYHKNVTVVELKKIGYQRTLISSSRKAEDILLMDIYPIGMALIKWSSILIQFS